MGVLGVPITARHLDAVGIPAPQWAEAFRASRRMDFVDWVERYCPTEVSGAALAQHLRLARQVYERGPLEHWLTMALN